MPKRNSRNINFRETKSERSAGSSYGNFAKKLKKLTTMVKFQEEKQKRTKI